MSEKQVFVGRKDELEQFKKTLEDSQGQGILVVGQAGMGKTFLVNKMAQIAANHPKLKCGYVRYEVTPTDTVDSTMALMMDNAFEAGQTTEGSLDGTKRGLGQWKALLNIVNLGDLVLSLRRDPAKNTREQFIERLNLISKRMPENGRAIFIIDPEKYMQKESDQSWAIVVKQLPEKIKFVFAQRNEDALVDSETFNNLNNVVRIPEKLLDVLDDSSVDELINLESAKIKYSIVEIKKTISNYNGHPYAVGAALELLKAGVKLEELPKKPEPIEFAKIQWDKICKKGDDAIRLFEAYAILEVGVPGDVAGAVSGLNSTTLKRLQKDNYLKGLLREEGEGKRIYHAILTDYILGQIGDDEKRQYHLRAVEIYREKLRKAKEEQIRPDELAATRLAEHVLIAEGKEAFVKTCAYETYGPLEMLGLLDTALGFSKRALDMVRKGSTEEAAVRCTMGLAYQTKGNLDEAEKMHLMALGIEERIENQVGMAREYGNLGLIYRTRGELDKAEEMHNKSLEIETKLGRLEGMASDYGNLGLIYESRGKLEKAEEMHKKALDMDKKMGNQEGIASDYGNLGIIYQIRGELDEAEEMHKKSLEISESRGMVELTANQYGNLGLIYEKKGDLDKAEDMHKKSLEIDTKLGRLEGMASDYGNLGLIYSTRGDLDKAKEYWVRARDLYEKIGLPHMIKQVQGLIDEVESEE